MMRDVFADVKPLTVVVRRPPRPLLIDRHKPRIVSFAKLCKRLLANLMQSIGVEGKIVAFYGLAASISEVHGSIPFSLDIGRPLTPRLTVQGMALVVSLCSSKMQHQST